MSATLRPLPEGHRLVTLENVDSTNAEAMRRALDGEPGPLWIVAERQTAGRGRSGRSWTSESGNLFASLVATFPADVAPKAYQLSLVTGVAAVDSVRTAMEPGEVMDLRLKWPNDLLLDGAKVGGILVESTITAHGLVAIVGIGLNLTSHPGGTPYPATHLARHGALPSKEKLLVDLASSVAEWLSRWQEGAGFAAVRTAWLERAGPIGERCSVHCGQDRVEGRFAGLDGDGALLVLGPDGRTTRVTYGDVTLPP